MKRNVLISVPNNNPGHVVYLPTIWATLKTHCDRFPELRESLNWLDPVIMKGAPADLLAPYNGQPVAVLGLSCYSWNTSTNMALAAEVKRRSPDCIVVAGGPDLDIRSQDFFARFPMVDIVVLRDGELAFQRILEQLATGMRDWNAIPGLVLRPSAEERANGRVAHETASPELPQTFGPSPWLANAAYLEALMARLRAENPQRAIGIPWEIDRGCPYACSFCDWGSNTRSKVRAIGLDRIREEADWIARNRIQVTFLTAANFGILPRDEAILDAIVAAKEAHGFPRVFIWNNAKNHVDRVARMNAKAFRAGLVDFHILSVQSLDDDVLAAMNRKQIDKKHLIAVAARAREERIPCVAQLIFGGPADTLDKFLGSLTALMELGVHDEYVAYPFDVLPNAPASDPDYVARWGIRTIVRRGSVNKRSTREDSADVSRIIVATHSHDEDEFVEMYVRGRLLIALHNSGLTQHLARYWRHRHDVPYADFYRLLIDAVFLNDASEWHAVYRHCRDHIARFVGPDGVDMVETITVPELPDLDYQLSVEEYVLYRTMAEIDRFYAAVHAALDHGHGPDPHLDSLIAFQRGVMIDPGYDPAEGRVVSIAHDWPAWFRQLERSDVQSVPAQLIAGDFTLAIDRTHSGSHFQYPLNWHGAGRAPEEAMALWIRQVVGKHYQRVERAYFKNVEAMPRCVAETLDSRPMEAARGT